MKITKMRYKGKRLTKHKMKLVANKLKKKIKEAGFITDTEIVSNAGIKMSGYGRHFSIDIKKLGYNALIYNQGHLSHIRGYKRTDVPTWSQREDMNHIVNDVLDFHNIDCNVISGEFEVRTFHCGRENFWNEGYNGYSEIVPLEAELVLEGEEKIKEHNRKKYQERKNEKAKEKMKLRLIEGGSQEKSQDYNSRVERVSASLEKINLLMQKLNRRSE